MSVAALIKRFFYSLFLILMFAACHPMAPVPWGTVLTSLSEGRVERAADELPTELQESIGSAVEQAVLTRSRGVTDPRWQNVDLRRVVMAGDWALVEAVHEYEYQHPSSLQTPTYHPHEVHYLHQEEVGWQVVDEREVPGVVQRTLWGPEMESCTHSVCLHYRAFDQAYIAEATVGLDAFAQAVAAQFDVTLNGREPFTIHVVPSGTDMWLQEERYKTFSPLSLPGIYFEERGISVGAFLRRGVMEMLTYRLVAEAVGPEQTRDRWPCAVEALAQWTVEAELDSMEWRALRNQETLKNRDREGGTWMSATEFLDPTQLLPCSGRFDQRLLFYTFLHERSGQDLFANLLRILYATDNPSEVAVQTFDVDVDTLQVEWETWLEEQRQQ